VTSGRINYCLGAWLILAAILNFSQGWIVLNNLLVGIIAAIIGCSMIKYKFCQGWLTVILGYWLFLSIFSAGLITSDVIFWNSLIVGTLIIIGGLGSVDKKLSKPKKYDIHLN
jgi:hypothetical protein